MSPTQLIVLTIRFSEVQLWLHTLPNVNFIGCGECGIFKGGLRQMQEFQITCPKNRVLKDGF